MTKDKLLYYMLDFKKKAFWIPQPWLLLQKKQWHCWLISKDDEISKQYISSNLAKKEDDIHRPISSLKSIVSNMQVKKKSEDFLGSSVISMPP